MSKRRESWHWGSNHHLVRPAGYGGSDEPPCFVILSLPLPRLLRHRHWSRGKVATKTRWRIGRRRGCAVLDRRRPGGASAGADGLCDGDSPPTVQREGHFRRRYGRAGGRRFGGTSTCSAKRAADRSAGLTIRALRSLGLTSQRRRSHRSARAAAARGAAAGGASAGADPAAPGGEAAQAERSANGSYPDSLARRFHWCLACRRLRSWRVTPLQFDNRFRPRPAADHEAFVAAEPPTGRVIVIAPTRAACETIELALGLHLDTLLEQQHGARDPRAGARGQGLRHRRRHRNRQDALDPADRRDDSADDALQRRRRESRARGDARDADVERHRRHHRHRPPLVPGRRHSADRYARRRRDPSDVGRARALSRARQARRLPLHLAVGDGRSDLLRALSRTSAEVLETLGVRSRRRRRR